MIEEKGYSLYHFTNRSTSILSLLLALACYLVSIENKPHILIGSPAYDCQNIKSDTPTWTIRLCTAVTAHVTRAFLFLAQQEQCVQSGNISLDNEINSLVRRHVGPHDLFVLIEGAETLWIPQEYLGNCVYRFRFSLATPALLHRLYAVQLRSNFLANNEVMERHPHTDVVVICNAAFISVPFSTPQISIDQPICGRAAGEGRFVFLGNTTSMFSETKTTLTLHDMNAFPTTSFFVDLRAPLVQWQPYSCELTQLSQDNFRDQSRGLRVDFAGDSHMRILFNHLLRVLCGVPVAAQKGFHESQCLDFETMPLCPHFSACLINAPYMDFGDSEGHGAARDLLIAGFGNWPAGSAHWTVRKYFEKVKSFAEAYTIGGKRRLVWLGIVPISFVSGRKGTMIGGQWEECDCST